MLFCSQCTQAHSQEWREVSTGLGMASLLLLTPDRALEIAERHGNRSHLLNRQHAVCWGQRPRRNQGPTKHGKLSLQGRDHSERIATRCSRNHEAALQQRTSAVHFAMDQARELCDGAQVCARQSWHRLAGASPVRGNRDEAGRALSCDLPRPSRYRVLRGLSRGSLRSVDRECAGRNASCVKGSSPVKHPVPWWPSKYLSSPT